MMKAASDWTVTFGLCPQRITAMHTHVFKESRSLNFWTNIERPPSVERNQSLSFTRSLARPTNCQIFPISICSRRILRCSSLHRPSEAPGNRNACLPQECLHAANLQGLRRSWPWESIVEGKYPLRNALPHHDAWKPSRSTVLPEISFPFCSIRRRSRRCPISRPDSVALRANVEDSAGGGCSWAIKGDGKQIVEI
jgi:hypothetical protein